jgi:tetratricopeptide (TPR) repeat protein
VIRSFPAGAWKVQRTTTAGLFLAAALAAGVSAQQAPKQDGETRFENGITHLREGRLELALEEMKAAAKADPKSPYFQKGLGVAWGQMADRCPDAKCRENALKASVEASRKAVELNPYYVDARNDLGTALLRSGKREEGRKELVTAFNDATNPAPAQTARNLGQSYLEERNYAEALNWFQTSVGRDKTYVDSWLGIADTLAAQGRVDESIRQLEAALRGQPDSTTLLGALGEAYYRAGRFDEARPRLQTVASKDPTGPAGRRAAELLKKFPSP